MTTAPPQARNEPAATSAIDDLKKLLAEKDAHIRCLEAKLRREKASTQSAIEQAGAILAAYRNECLLSMKACEAYGRLLDPTGHRIRVCSLCEWHDLESTFKICTQGKCHLCEECAEQKCLCEED